jgi:small subunit ribosomal protein S3Ae
VKLSTRRKRERTELWLEVTSPSYLGEKPIGNMLVYSEQEAIGRILEILYSDITEDPSHSYTKIKLRIVEVSGGVAKTSYWGHEVSRDYLRSILRRSSSKVEPVIDVSTKDGYLLRLGVTLITREKISSNKSTFIHNLLTNMMKGKVSSMKLHQFVQDVMSGKTESDIFNLAKKHSRVKYAGVSKVKILQIPEAKKEEVVAT